MDKNIKALFTDNIVEFAARKYGVSRNDLKFIACWQNSVYEYNKTGRQYILRITHESHRSKELLKQELCWITYLADNKIRVCTPIPSLNSEIVEDIEIDRNKFFVTVFNKARGSKIGVLEMWPPNIVEKCGEITGQIHLLSKYYDQNIRYPWYENGYIKSRTKYIPESYIDVLENSDAVMEQIQGFNKNKNNYGIVHGDINCGNFYIHNGEVVLYDFDECAQDWFVDDIAIQLFYFTYVFENREERTDYFMRHFLKGYCKYNNIDKDELQRIPLFLKLRELIVFVGACRGCGLINMDKYTQSFVDRLTLRGKGVKPYVEFDFSKLKV